MDVIRIRGLTVEACHGVHGFEKTSPQKFMFDADIATDFFASAQSDDLSKTISYSEACAVIERIVKGNVFNLIEKLAYECAFSVMEKFPSAESITLTVWKPDAPMKREFASVGVTVTVEREKVYLSLGSSMGDKKNAIDTAIAKLNATRGISVDSVSDYITTEPYGGVAKNEFLNCAAEVTSLLSPHALLSEIHRIEAECGRVRDKRWDDRTLDIDIIFFGNKKISDRLLTVPHPDYLNRDFVKIPLKQIAPHLFQNKVNN